MMAASLRPKANRGVRGYPRPQTIRRALNALQRMPDEAVADLVERLIDRLDAIGPEPDLEDDNEDCCSAGDDRPDRGGAIRGSSRFLLVGDDTDGEESDVGEPDDEDHGGGSEDEPRFPRRPFDRHDDMVTTHRQLAAVIKRKRAPDRTWEARS